MTATVDRDAREGSVRPGRDDPATMAWKIHAVWSAQTRHLVSDDDELYELLDWRVQVVEELAKLVKAERGGVVRSLRAAAKTWREIAVRLRRAESTLRGHAKDR